MIESKELINYSKNLSILLVEDDIDLRTNMAEILSNFFKNVSVAENGKEALSIYTSYVKEQDAFYDIVLTDIRMPKMNGVELTKELYKINAEQFVIVLSAHDESDYLLPLINLGIEQFIKKPIDFQELLEVLLRTSKILHRSKNIAHEENQIFIYLDENCIYNKETKSLSNQNENIYLTKYEILFMQLLASNAGIIYSNEDIVEYYHSKGESMDAQNIRKLVSKIRKKLPENSLESIYGIGYRFLTLK